MNNVVYNNLANIQNDLRLFAYKLTRDKEKAEDLLQETNLRALQKSDKYLSDKSLIGWCVVMMKNLFINECRVEKSRNEFIDRTEIGFFINGLQKQSSGQIEEMFDCKQVMEAINRLNDIHKNALKMYISGFMYKEIGEAENISIGTVKSRISNGRKLVREYLRMEL